MKKRFVRCFLAVLLIIASISPASAMEEANAKEKTTTKKIDHSREYPNGKITNSVKYVKLGGSTAKIKKINKALKNEAVKNLWDEDQMDSFEEAYYDQFHDTDQYELILSQETTEKAAFNKKNILSVKLDYYTYGGGAHPYGETYGLTFNVKTGKKLKLTDVAPKKYNPRTKSGYRNLLDKIFRQVEKKFSSFSALKFAEWCTQKQMKNIDFYITKSGKIVVCFSTEVLGGNGSSSVAISTVKSKF